MSTDGKAVSGCETCERCETEIIEAGAAAECVRIWALVEPLLVAADFMVGESYSGGYSRQKYDEARGALVAAISGATP